MVDDVDRRNRRAWTALTASTVVVGFVLRIWILRSPTGRVDSDEAVVGLMSRWVADGHRPPLFFWGQHYGGTIEPLLVAIGQRLHEGRIALKAVPFALSAVSGLIITVPATRLLDRHRGRLVGALVFAWPGTTWLATKERGFYWVGMVLVCTAIAFAVDLVLVGQRQRRWALYGFVVGLAWYNSAQCAYVLAPLTIWLLVVARPTARTLAVTGVGAVVGVSPWLVGLHRYGSDVFSQEPTATSYLDRLHDVVFQLLPRTLGVRNLFVSGWTFGLVGVALAIATLAVVAQTLRQAVDHHRRGTGPNTAALLCALALPFPVLAAVPHLSQFVSEPRYGLYFVPVFALLLVHLSSRLRLNAILVAVVLAVAVGSTATLLDTAREHPQLLDLVPTEPDAVARSLAARGITHLYGDYWIANPITFLDRRVAIASPLDRPRVPWVLAEVDAARSPVWVVYADSARDRALPDALHAVGTDATRVVDGDLAIYVLDRYVDPSTFSTFWAEHPAGH